jgi:hypothetical protein
MKEGASPEPQPEREIPAAGEFVCGFFFSSFSLVQ